MTELAAPSPQFYALTLLSALIASFGLLANSAAVVIGAMLIAPLMGPIFGLTLGLVLGNTMVLRRAAVAEASGVALAILLGFLVGLFPLQPEFGAEIISRTAPTILDLAVALVSGIVGAYSMVNRKVSESIAGVAIATAIVPPLATCGICLASGMLQQAFGAFLLFGSNFVAIQFAATLVFLLSGIEEGPLKSGTGTKRIVRILAPGLLLLCLLSIIMTQALVRFVEKQQLESYLRSEISTGLRGSQGAQLDSLQIEGSRSQLEVTASVLTPKEIGMAQVAALESRIEQETGRQLHLVVRSLLSRDVDCNGTVYISEEEREQRESAAQEAGELALAAEALRTQLSRYPGAHLEDVELRADGRLIASVQTPEEIGPQRVAELQAGLVARLGGKLRLVVRSIITRDADAERYIYEPQKVEPVLNPNRVILQAKLETLLRLSLQEDFTGAALNELKYWETEPLLIQATIRAPHGLSPGEVSRLERNLDSKLGRDTRLVVRTMVEAWADREGFITGLDPPVLAAQEDTQGPQPAQAAAL